MFRSFQTRLDASGNGFVSLSPYVESIEWDIYQVSIQTATAIATCTAEIRHNGFFLCSTAQGSKDSATGPPDCVVQASDMFSIYWFNGQPNDQATVGIWFNENPAGTTYSSAH